MMNLKYLAGVLQPREQPKASDLLNLLQVAVTDSADFLSRMELNDRVKSCYWEGQSLDGRKHEDDLDAAALPWEGASDQRVRVARMLVTEEKLVCAAALAAGSMQAEAVDSGDDPATAAAQAPLLRWLLAGPMRQEVRDEVDFLLDWRATYGHAVLAIDWHQTRQLRQESITYDQLLQLAMDAALAAAQLPPADGLAELQESGQAPPELLENAAVIMEQTSEKLIEALMDPAQTDRLVDLVNALLNPEGQTVLSVPKAEIRRVVRALQRGEPGVYFRPWLKEDRPRWCALLPWVDVFYPPSTTRLADAPWIARVHWLSESRLRDRAQLEDWDGDWVEKTLQHPGNCYSETILNARGRNRSWVLGGSAVLRGQQREESAATRLYQVIELFQTSTAQMGVPTLYRTVLHPSVTDSLAIHGPVVEAQGCYGFVEFRRQREDSRYLMDARGIPEDVMSHQSAIKAQHDARTNRTDLELLPPAFIPMNSAGGSYNLAPMAQIPVRRTGPIEYMKPPPVSMDSVAITAEEWAMVDRMFGRWSDTVPAALTQLHMQSRVNDFLVDLSRACQQTFDLCRQYFDDTAWQRITGMPKPAEDPYRQDLIITFDARNLSMEWLKELMELYTAFVIPNDSEGVIDRAAFVQYVFSAINPQVAGRVIKPKEQAAEGEMENELSQLAIIMSGAEPPQKQGQNYALRLRVLQTFIAASTEIQNKLNSNEQIKAVMEARMKFFRNQMQQQANAIIGRTMQQPVMGAGAA